MKKIIAAFDGLKYSISTRDYAIDLAKKTNAHLVGVFMEDLTYTSYKIYELITSDGISPAKLKKLEQYDKDKRMAAVRDFEKKCRESGIEYSIHRDRKIAIHELKHEAIYADLLVIDSNETLTHYTEKLPTRFIRDLLVDAQCPVLLVPAQYKPVQKIILLYDGAPSSVYAIRLSSYMLPGLKQLTTEVLSVKPVHSTLKLPDDTLMKEFIKTRFPAAKFIIMKGQPEEKIKKYLQAQHGHALVVLGAYSRGNVSRWFKESMADVLMKDTKLPLFVAHSR